VGFPWGQPVALDTIGVVEEALKIKITKDFQIKEGKQIEEEHISFEILKCHGRSVGPQSILSRESQEYHQPNLH
jgi:hypothetical protein